MNSSNRGRLAAERLRFVGIGEFLHGPVEVIAENQINRPLLQPFFGPTTRLPHRRIWVDERHEAAATERVSEGGPDLVERQQGGGGRPG